MELPKELEKFLQFVAEAGGESDLQECRYWAYTYLEFLSSQAQTESQAIIAHEDEEEIFEDLCEDTPAGRRDHNNLIDNLGCCLVCWSSHKF